MGISVGTRVWNSFVDDDRYQNGDKEIEVYLRDVYGDEAICARLLS